MGGEPTRTQSQTGQPDPTAAQDWYVVTDGGASFRIASGLVLGESDGTLVLNDPDAAHQWVEIVLADRGDPWLNVVNRGKSLRVADETCLQHHLQVGATIEMPNGALYISQNIYTPQLSECVIEVVDREVPHHLQDLMGPGWEEALAQVQSRAAEESESKDPVPEPLARAGLPGPEDRPDDPLRMTEPRPRRRTRPSDVRQRQTTAMVGVVGLGAGVLIGAIAVYLSTGENQPTPIGNLEPDPIVNPQVSPLIETPMPDRSGPPADPRAAASPGDRSVTTTEAAPTDAAAGEPAAAQPQPAEPATTAGEIAGVPDSASSGAPETADSGEPPGPGPAADAGTGSAAGDDAAGPPVEVVTLPPAEPDPAPQVAQDSEPSLSSGRLSQEAAAAAAPAVPETAGIQPDPAMLAELEEVGLLAQALATELAGRRDLAAADLALAEGRLSTPAETSAYTLYNRVLAVDPGSPEATSGLQSVRRGLINRAMAQLAGGNLDDARQTLQAAADAGADPALIANLNNEVDYRQQRTGSRVE